VLAVLVCVQQSDTLGTADTAATEVAKLADVLRPPGVAIVPFAHLATDLMQESRRATEIISELAVILRRFGLEVAMTSFGYHKDFEFHLAALGHPSAVAFRDVGSV
jgi:hypothetical protein